MEMLHFLFGGNNSKITKTGFCAENSGHAPTMTAITNTVKLKASS